MRKSIFFLKKLTSAEVGETKTHEKYVRLPNDFDYESFFPGLAKENGNVIQVDFTAKNCTIGHSSEPNIVLKFVFYSNSNHEKRIPSLSEVFTANNVQSDDVVCIESRTENGVTSYFITFTKSDMASLNPAAVTYSLITEDATNEERQRCASLNLQQIYYGAPGTGKSHTINEQTEGESVIRTTFHPDSDYSTFVGAYKPTTKEVDLRDVSGHKIFENGEVVKEDRIVYEFVDQAFLQAYVKAWMFYAEKSEKPAKQYLVIEEINRGNCAQIFGDLFQLLDRNKWGFSDYPINADKDMKKQLAKAFKNLTINDADTINGHYKGRDVVKEVLNGDILLLPNNLYIWATMNTSDQSLFPIDSAFKRRWDWQYMPIAQGRDEAGNLMAWTIDVNNKKYSWWSFLEKVNAQIGEATQSEDKKLGFFFCKAVDGVISSETFVGKVVFYLWNDVFKDYGFDGPIFKDADNSELSFNKFYKADLKGNAVVQKDKVEQFLKNLGVEIISTTSGDDPMDEVDEDGNNANTANKDFSKYAINGKGSFSKGKVMQEAMKLYAEKHPEMTADQVMNTWLAMGVNMPNLVETQALFEERAAKSKDSRVREKAKEVQLANGETIFVSNQFNPDRIADLISKVNAQDWDIKISKI